MLFPRGEPVRTLSIPILLVSLVSAGPAPAQHTAHGGHAAGPAVSRHEEARRRIESFDRVVAAGRGFGMAFAADRNGYPGPLHVLELGNALGLSSAQASQVRLLETAMLAESRPRSAALLAAERQLDALFTSGRATEADLALRVAEVERLRGEVRMVHLRYHLKTRDVLTEQQRLVYHERRWGGGGADR
jgi:Spy/CpxP family protein refolding chaperone